MTCGDICSSQRIRMKTTRGIRLENGTREIRARYSLTNTGFVTRFTRCMRRCDVRCPRRLAPVSNRRRVHHQKLAPLQRQIRPILPPRRLPLARHGHSRHAFNPRLHFHRKRRLFLRRTGVIFRPKRYDFTEKSPRRRRESRGRGVPECTRRSGRFESSRARRQRRVGRVYYEQQ